MFLLERNVFSTWVFLGFKPANNTVSNFFFCLSNFLPFQATKSTKTYSNEMNALFLHFAIHAITLSTETIVMYVGNNHPNMCTVNSYIT